MAITISEFENLSSGMKILEIGPGNWTYPRKLAICKGCEWYGVEIYDHKYAVKTDLESIPFPDQFFDYVYGAQTMEHWTGSFAKKIREIHRVLKTGATLSLNVPIHTHGHPMFIEGDLERVHALFQLCLWSDIVFDEWRKEHAPLKPDIEIRGKPSAWVLRMRARKRLIPVFL